MDIETIREFCLSLAHATEDIQWGNDLLFRVGGKIFAVVSLEPSPQHRLSFKCTPEEFAELTEQDGVVPAPYVARYHWIALERFDALPWVEMKRLIRQSHSLVFEKLPKKIKLQLDEKQKKPRGKMRDD